MSFWQENLPFIKGFFDERSTKFLELMDNAEKSIEQVTADTIYTSKQFQRIKDNFDNIVKNLERQEVRDWLQNTREILEGEKKMAAQAEAEGHPLPKRASSGDDKLTKIFARFEELTPKVNETKLITDSLWKAYEYTDDLVPLMEFTNEQLGAASREIFTGSVSATEDIIEKHLKVMDKIDKKKKKKTPFDPDAAEKDAEDRVDDGVEEEAEEKSEKKKVAFDEPDDVDNIEDIDLESFGKKKKKKKKREGGLDGMNDLKEGLPDDDKEVEDDLDLESFGMKKKKKKKPKDLDDLIGDDEKEEGQDENPWMESDRDYTYEELLQRVFSIMRDKNPDMVDGRGKKFVMRPPQVVRVGTKKTAFANFNEIAKMLHRQPKHLLSFLFAELGTSGAIDGNNQLIMKGKFQQKHIENVLRRYIKEYVTCHTCRSPDTILNKETRLFFLQCMTCHSSCSVQTIKTGFQAVTSKRAAIRAKQ